jgi:exodeoxyribonuclease V gamma subunit
MGQLNEALQNWLETCASAEFDEAVPLAVLREAWLGALDEPTLNHQFVSGGVTVCTLMPMRAVPFRVVCLLGMNDGDFPRRARQADFDLLALAGMARPGDRSRRDDDRYLMLEALLAARDKLYVSWVGRNVRDNSEQPASVLVSQLRDYLQAGWKLADLEAMTTEHALQPFSRSYFEEGGLLTYAAEWRAAHGAEAAAADNALPPFELESGFSLKLGELASFVKQPARYFFRRRLGVAFGDPDLVGEDEEPFALDALERYFLEDSLLDDGGPPEAADEVRDALGVRAERLAREGLLPIGLAGELWQRELVEGLVPVRSAWLALRAQLAEAAPKLAVSLAFDGVHLDDWIDQLRAGADGTAWLMQVSSKVLDKEGQARGDKLVGPWLRQLSAAAMDKPVAGYLVARDAIVHMAPLDPGLARLQLAALTALWQRNMDAPLPVACKSALALLRQGDPRKVYDGGFELPGEVDDLCLARLWSDFASLASDGRFAEVAQALYGPLVQWLADSVAIAPMEGGAQ